MAKVKQPVFSISAKGSIGKTLTFLDRKEGSVVTAHHKPSGPPSGMQKYIRRLNKFVSLAWSNLLQSERELWKKHPESAEMSGWNIFYKKFVEGYLETRRPWRTPDRKFLWAEMFTDDLEAVGEEILQNPEFYENYDGWDVTKEEDDMVGWSDGIVELKKGVTPDRIYLDQGVNIGKDKCYLLDCLLKIPGVSDFGRLKGYVADDEGGFVLETEGFSNINTWERFRAVFRGYDVGRVGVWLQAATGHGWVDKVSLKELESGPEDVLIKNGRLNGEGFMVAPPGRLTHEGGDRQDLAEGAIEFDILRSGNLSGGLYLFYTSSMYFTGAITGPREITWVPNFAISPGVFITSPDIPEGEWIRFKYEYSQSGKFLRIRYNGVIVAEKTNQVWQVAPNDTECWVLGFQDNPIRSMLVRNVLVSGFSS